MAFDIKYVFRLIDKYTNVNKSIGKSIDTTTRKIDKQRRAFKLLGSTGKKMLTALKFRLASFVVGLALTGFGTKKVIETFTSFEDKLLDLKAITGATGQDLLFLRNRGLDLSRKFRGSGADIFEAMKLVGSAKPELLKNIPALASLTEEVLLLKTAAGIDLADAAKITARSLNIFGKSSKLASEFVNILAAGAKFGTSEVKDTGAAILKVGSTAADAGLSFLKLNALIQTLARAGQMGTVAGTGLNTVLTRITKLNPKLLKTLKNSFVEITPEMRKLALEGIDFNKLRLSEAFIRIRKALDSAKTPMERVALGTELFGLRQKKVGLALVRNAELLDQFEGKLQGTNEANKQADIRLSGLSTAFGRVGEVLKEKFFKLVERFRPLLIDLAEQVIVFLDAFDINTFDAIGGAINTLLLLLDGVLRMLNAILKVTALLASPLLFLLGRKDVFKDVGKLLFGSPVLDIPDVAAEKALNVTGTVREISAATPGNQNQKISLDINLNDPGNKIANVRGTSKGDLDMNVGRNLAFVG
jgi:TP901 family phage tail tape measure protein